MTPEEVAMTTTHPLCNRDCVATLRQIYTETGGGIVTGKISDWMKYTVSDSDSAVANGLMAVFPSATHLNCNVHHLVKGLGLGGGLRKSLVLPATQADEGEGEGGEEGQEEQINLTEAQGKRKRRKKENAAFEVVVQVCVCVCVCACVCVCVCVCCCCLLCRLPLLLLPPLPPLQPLMLWVFGSM